MRRYIATVSIVLGLLGCNALDEKGSEGGSRLLIPVDDRPVVQALTTPPPISGGTLAVSPDGQYAVVADPDRDRVSIVTLATRDVRHVGLDLGDEPGRVVVDTRGRAHVGLRRGGDIARIDIANATLEGRTRVCPSPRGLTLQNDLLHVACADGRLVTLDAQGAMARSVDLGTDLRDVMVRNGELLVSTYKSAELLMVDGQGAVRDRVQPATADMVVQRPIKSGEGIGGTASMLQTMQPHLAWRSVQSADGKVVMLHQNASEMEVDIDSEPTPDTTSSYGGGGEGPGSCNGIVHTAVTGFGSTGGARTLAIAGSVLAVDVARSPRDGNLAIAIPGGADIDAPRPQVVFQGDDEGGAIGSPAVARAFPGAAGQVVYISGSMFDEPMLEGSRGGPTECVFAPGLPVSGQPTAVAFTPNGDLLVQSREPAMLFVMPAPPTGVPLQIDLGGDSVRDTGHDVFHRDAGAGIACASCHGEGGDDGHTWVFSGLGARRTQQVNVGLAGTAPFHWDGELHDLGALMEEVFVGRMGGVHQSKERLGALSDWLFAQEPPNPIVLADDPAAERGRMLFESEAGCVRCHSGASLTDNRSYDVGTGEHGEKMQVPSLRGVGYRAPFIHDGCAKTLRDRFDPACGGGDKHGDTAHLEPAQVDDLIAYLRSL